MTCFGADVMLSHRKSDRVSLSATLWMYCSQVLALASKYSFIKKPEGFISRLSFRPSVSTINCSYYFCYHYHCYYIFEFFRLRNLPHFEKSLFNLSHKLNQSLTYKCLLILTNSHNKLTKTNVFHKAEIFILLWYNLLYLLITYFCWRIYFLCYYCYPT